MTNYEEFPENAIKWHSVKRELERQIIVGQLDTMERVPSISELAERYSIGKTTAKKVLGIMCEEGTLARKRGIGYFVSPYRKEKLKEKQLEDIKNGIKSLFEQAISLGLTFAEAQHLVYRCIGEKE